MIFISCQVN